MVRIRGDRLALWTHPSLVEPVLQRADGWGFDDVSEAFDQTFSHHLQPLGVVTVHQEVTNDEESPTSA